MDSALLLTIPGVGYCAASGLHALRVARGATTRALGPRALVYGCLALHAAALAWRIALLPAAPLTGVRESAVLVSLLMVVGYLVAARRLRGDAVAAIVLLAAGVGLVTASLSLPAAPAQVAPVLQSPRLLFHVPVVLGAFIANALAGSAAVMYLVVSGLLKRRRPLEWLRNLPTLESLERFSHRAAELGFVLLTAGLLSGMMWAHSVWGSPLSTTPKQMVAVVTWLMYAGYFHARFVKGWRGRLCAWMLVAGCVIAVCGYVIAATGVDAHNFG